MNPKLDVEITGSQQPLVVFQEWMTEAKAVPTIREATAMSVATLGTTGELHARVVLCKQWSDDGFVFYSNYQSLKGLDLQHNSQAAAVFYWDPMFRQVRISGRVQKTSRAVSEAYWNSRPRDSQLSQYTSHQSQEVSSRDELERAWLATEQSFAGKNIPCPEHWGGYVLVPSRIEFWLGRASRLHDRYEFHKSGTHWTFRRLYP